jgi:hypothetical protein
MDAYRRFSGRESYFGRRVEKELDDEQVAQDKKKQYAKDERFNEVFDRLHFFFREEERHGRVLS